MILLLLTACINPGNTSFTALNNQEERKAQYIKALNYYISKTNYKIVFTENSNIDISPLFVKEIKSGRLECLTFSGNKEKNRGKGVGECEIIQHALDNSTIINRYKKVRIVKITGRLIIKNIRLINNIHRLLFPINTILFAINSDISFPDSRYIIAPASFYIKLLNLKKAIDDSVGYYFEHALLDTLIKENNYSYSPFFIQPDIVGVSGTTGKLYGSQNHNISHTLKYIKYAASLRSKFKKRYRTNSRLN